MKKNISIICCLISLIISGCGSSGLFAPPLTPTPVATSTPAATSTPTESPEEIIANVVTTACQMSPTSSPAVGVSTGGQAVARLCPDVESGITLPEEWTATTPADLRYVVAVQNGGTEVYGRCGPYSANGQPEPGGGTYVPTAMDIVEISLINIQTGKVVDFARIYGPESSSSCPLIIYGTSPLTGGPPSAQDVQKEIVDLLSNQEQSPTWSILLGHTDQVMSVAFSPDGKLLASGSWDSTIILWGVASGQKVHTLTGHNKVTSVAFSPDGKLLASGSWDSTIILWDVASGQEVRTLENPTGMANSVAFSPDGKLLASGLISGTVKLWDVASGQEVRTLTGHTAFVTSVAFSPDGKLLASGSFDKTVKLWDVASGQEVHTLTGYTDQVTSVAFSPDGKLLASGSVDETVKLWDVASEQEVHTLHMNNVISSVAFSPDGKLLASGSSLTVKGYTVKLWDVASGQEVRTLTGHNDFVTSVAFSPDGKLLASGSFDKTVMLWEVNLP